MEAVEKLSRRTVEGLEDLYEITKRIDLTIENDINPKIQLLFDGHASHSEQLNRIEKEVTWQREVILQGSRFG